MVRHPLWTWFDVDPDGMLHIGGGDYLTRQRFVDIMIVKVGQDSVDDRNPDRVGVRVWVTYTGRDTQDEGAFLFR